MANISQAYGKRRIEMKQELINYGAVEVEINDNYYVITGNNVTLSNEDYKSFRIIHNLQFSSFEDNSDLHFVRIYKNTQFNYLENQQYINIIKKIVYETKN